LSQVLSSPPRRRGHTADLRRTGRGRTLPYQHRPRPSCDRTLDLGVPDDGKTHFWLDDPTQATDGAVC